MTVAFRPNADLGRAAVGLLIMTMLGVQGRIYGCRGGTCTVTNPARQRDIRNWQMLKFDGKQGDLSVEIRFAAPAFGLMALESQRLYDRLYGVLGKYGVTANDIVQDNTPDAFGSKSLTYTVNLLATAVKVQIWRVEITCWDLKRLSTADGTTVFIGVLDALVETLPDLQFEGYSANLSMHGAIAGQTATEFIGARIGRELEGLGPSTGHALAYYFGENGPRRRLVIVLDGSAAYLDALYLRQNVDYEGKGISYKRVPDLLVATFNGTLEALGLEASQ